jgi:putative transposase
LISSEKKAELVQYIQEAVTAGARLKRACEVIEISFATFLRWRAGKLGDQRKGAPKRIVRKLTQAEKDEFYAVANQPRFRDLTAAQIVATLLEEGIWYGSESTLCRILKSHNALLPRTESRSPHKRHRPPELVATGPNQVWAWDITWLKTDVAGIFVFAYVIIDIYSRKIVGWSIENSESADYAQTLFRRIIRDTGVCPQFVHADNGSPMKGLSLVAFLTSLKVGLTYSRPRVSDDNPFIESFFKTVKYRVGYPKAFTGLQHAREWMSNFIDWYNNQHRHSGIQYVTPQQRHSGNDIALLEIRQQTLQAAAKALPERFVNGPRKIAPESLVVLNKAS